MISQYCSVTKHVITSVSWKDVKSCLLEELKNMCFLTGKHALIREDPLSEIQFYSSVMVRLLQMEIPSH